jgi:hypothetical protein
MFFLCTFLTETSLTKTTAATDALAATAVLLTTRTDLGFTASAIVRARRAAEPVAPLATNQAIAAENVAAPSAGNFVILAQQVAATIAGQALPIGQGDVGTAGVARVENSAHDLEKVAEPPATKGAIDCHLTVPFAEAFPFHVRMRGVARFSRRIRVQCDDIVGTPFADPIPVQLDLEPAQADLFQNNRFRRHGKRLVRQIEADGLEFVGEPGQFAEDLADRRQGCHARR